MHCEELGNSNANAPPADYLPIRTHLEQLNADLEQLNANLDGNNL